MRDFLSQSIEWFNQRYARVCFAIVIAFSLIHGPQRAMEQNVSAVIAWMICGMMSVGGFVITAEARAWRAIAFESLRRHERDVTEFIKVLRDLQQNRSID